MTSAQRLERLRTLIRSDMDALPDRPVDTAPEETVSDTEDGGVSLDPSSKSPLVSPDSRQLEPDPVPAQPLPTAANTDRQFVWMQGQQSSYNVVPNPKLSPVSTVKLSPPVLSRGDLVSVSAQFTPILALAKYPYSFVNRNLMQGIASAFFDQSKCIVIDFVFVSQKLTLRLDKFWTREWDL